MFLQLTWNIWSIVDLKYICWIDRSLKNTNKPHDLWCWLYAYITTARFIEKFNICVVTHTNFSFVYVWLSAVDTCLYVQNFREFVELLRWCLHTVAICHIFISTFTFYAFFIFMSSATINLLQYLPNFQLFL